jgi:hypothetical protein
MHKQQRRFWSQLGHLAHCKVDLLLVALKLLRLLLVVVVVDGTGCCDLIPAEVLLLRLHNQTSFMTLYDM